MSRKLQIRLAVLAVIDAVVLALTIHANLTFHRTADSPTTASLGQVLGWVVFGILTMIIAFIVKESLRRR